MIRLPFLDGWTVGPKLGAFEAPTDATAPQPVTLPHDAIRDLERSADSTQGVHAGYYPGGVFEYAKTFDVPEGWRDRTIVLEFEGVYRDAVVFVNGDYAAQEPNGYNGFTVALDPFLRYGAANRITVDARSHKDSRWYSGAGIYRPVHLVIADPVHIPLDGVRVTTPDIDDERAMVAVATTARNTTRHTRTARIRWAVQAPDGAEVVEDSAPLTVLPGETATARSRLAVPEAQLWGPDSPSLYTVVTSLVDDEGTVLDEDRTRFGIRRLQLDAQRGLRINGEVVKLRGACVHHDNGPLGAATLDAAEDRRVRLLKDAGFNAIRSAHNPISRAMLDACDRHGVLVMDELTDVWTKSKTAFDASLGFPNRWQHDVAALVSKDFNHPSVVMYSIGNEILELATPIGASWSRRLAEGIRELDDTRFVTNGINGIIANLDRMGDVMTDLEASDPNTMMANMGEKMALMNASTLVTESTEESAAVLDIVGFNYADSRYELDAELFPHRVIVGSETFPEKIDVMWGLVTRLPHVIGDFTWTGWDYLGEAGIGRVDYTDTEGYIATGTSGPYPYLLAETGDIDITGHRRTVSFFREIVYGLRSDPYISVHRPEHHGRPTATTPWSWNDTISSWTWDAPEGAPVVVDVYAAADEVELLLDGASVGRARVGDEKAFVARIQTEWRPGELVAVATAGGVEVGRHSLRTAIGAASLAATAEEPEVNADGLGFVQIALLDESGTVFDHTDKIVTVAVDGPGVLAGLGTGRARTEEPFAGPSVTTYDGRALAIVRPTGPGTITVTVEAPGFAPATAELAVRR
ncbi:glycoside hydrolase family 2 TIM barrel-domain containing protein [Microbacterium sp.]|uniref:glycoside hydrolase family 2 TIM barrel-domain containing protein n=1 Tax=Microbacterium sp. TaxID=51671 RepID=UPI002E361B21|nr:glycoside hydrolase family 2 TIM barrel-domain containing protein [Microbacterium sp.]HEX5728713.1 glycoside hydrolase family 2 TIM barrel-domain containing protein [Microbacterium sp.]